ncbi:hypothetical protein D3C72_1658520 [compost metagenome]
MRVWPSTALQPLMESDERMFAHSDRLVLPRIIAPASRNRATSGASRPGALAARASEPAVVGISRVSILSFSRIGRPSNGPSPFGASQSVSSTRAIRLLGAVAASTPASVMCTQAA